jgi:hypothetical protein
MTLSDQSEVQRHPRAQGARHARKFGADANARLTSSTALVLLVLLAVEGVTVIQVRSLLTLHVFIGMLLVPPVLIKLASTFWRFAKYYSGSPDYRRKGPPPVVLRILGPMVAMLTIILFLSGILLMFCPKSWQLELLLLHKASFILWFGCMTVHVLGHAGETARLSTKDWVRRVRGRVAGSRARRLLISSSLISGLVLAFLTVPYVGPWLGARG